MCTLLEPYQNVLFIIEVSLFQKACILGVHTHTHIPHVTCTTHMCTHMHHTTHMCRQTHAHTPHMYRQTHTHTTPHMYRQTHATHMLQTHAHTTYPHGRLLLLGGRVPLPLAHLFPAREHRLTSMRGQGFTSKKRRAWGSLA